MFFSLQYNCIPQELIGHDNLLTGIERSQLGSEVVSKSYPILKVQWLMKYQSGFLIY